MNITPVILCGGSGTRLWPLSRQDYPKQFIKLIGDTTLFQQSISRAVALGNKDIKIEEILIVTNENHRFLVLEQLDDTKLKIPTRILLEPEPKNTAPALTLATLAAQDTNLDAVLVVIPADQYVKDLDYFNQAIHEAIRAAQKNIIVTLGINPTRPDTGFGYIHYEGDGVVKSVLSFKEKPDLQAAQKMIDHGQHTWNGGMFILQSKTWLKAIKQSNNEIFKTINNAWQKKLTDQWFERPDSELFEQTPSDSIDYAVMEKAKELGVDIKLVLLNASWSDVGSFNSLDDIEKKDSNGNIFFGNIVSLNTSKTIAISTKKNISLLGVENLIVVETADAVLVANKDDAQSIKNLVKEIKKDHQNLINEHTHVNRPWGFYEIVDLGDNFKVKRIVVKPYHRLSNQLHNFRNEHWVVVKGIATVILDGENFNLKHDESTYIKKGIKHQLINNQESLLEIIEVQTGEKVVEEDIERFEDDYNRV